MKKQYMAPEIMFEDFSLSATIAGSCERIVGNPTRGTCAVQGTGGINMFTNEVQACEFTPPDEDKWDGFCYHVPLEYYQLFNS